MFAFDGKKILTLFSAITLSSTLGACTAISSADSEAENLDESTGETVQALTGTHKVCSAIAPGNYRDSIVVSQGWSSTTCSGWAWSVGGTQWQLGCMWDNGFNWGAANGGIPPGNYCGWW